MFGLLSPLNLFNDAAPLKHRGMGHIHRILYFC